MPMRDRTQVNVRLPEAWVKALKRQAAAEEMSVNKLVRQTLMEKYPKILKMEELI